MAGTVHDKQYLALHNHAGKAKRGGENSEVTALEVNSIVPTFEPMIVHADGRTWVLSWDEIIAMAVKAFDEDAASHKPEAQS